MYWGPRMKIIDKPTIRQIGSITALCRFRGLHMCVAMDSGCALLGATPLVEGGGGYLHG